MLGSDGRPWPSLCRLDGESAYGPDGGEQNGICRARNRQLSSAVEAKSAISAYKRSGCIK